MKVDTVFHSSFPGKENIRTETNGSLVSLTDFYATFAQMVNYQLKDEEAVDSYSIWPILSKREILPEKILSMNREKAIYLYVRFS